MIEAAVANRLWVTSITTKAAENIAVVEEFLNPEEKKPVGIKPKETKPGNLPVLSRITEEKDVNPEIQNLITAHNLGPLLTKIHSQYKMNSKVSSTNKPIETWEIEDCKAWANQIKNRFRNGVPADFESSYLSEMITVLLRATQLYAGYLPRDVQIASLLLLLKKPDKRRLAQIATGEGKSLIVAMLAVMKSLQGEVVDIVTSSPVLAARDAEEMHGFYSIFDLTVADNWDEKEGGKYKGGYKSCYSADIVYGDACSFQWDTLRQEYLKDGTRGNRPYQTVIVDEADSMLIDQFADSGELVVTKPAMEYLNLLLVAAWQELARIEQHLGGITAENTPAAKKILKNFLTELTTGSSSPIYIPSHLKELAIDHIESWVESAFVARYQYVNGRDYIIIKGKEKGDDDIIASVDYSNTGVLHSNMVWNNGLHQFLQIRHQLKVFPESIFSPEISNMAYFNRYTNGLYGMSGTLGSKVTQEVLQEAYTVDFVFVPTFKTKRFSEIPPVVSENDDAWLSAVIESVTRESAAGKPVLLICESINDVERIESKLAEFYRTPKPAHVKRYSRSDTSENLVVSNKIESGQIIIATNLAGRGTDIKPEDKVEASGGLHVCLAYLPNNQRVEDQALGRTARQGKSGTGQLIINKKRALTKLSKYFQISNIMTIPQLKKLRDEAEIIELNNIKNFGIKKVTLQDKLFSKFCTLRKELFALNDNKYLFSEIEDRYGLWLKKGMDRIEREKKIESDVILAEFETFRQDCLRIYKESGLKNPAQLILDANSTEDYVKAIQAYSKAIELDPLVATQAFFNRAFARLATKGENAKELAQSDLAIAKKQLQEQLIPQLQTMHILRQLSPEQLAGFSDLTKQIQAKIQFYEHQIQHIDNTIKFLQEAKTPHFEVRENFGRFADLCNDLHMSGHQIQELYDSGMKGFYELEAIPEENDSLWGLLGVTFLGVMQIVAGVAITLVQPAIGAALISEGVGDIMFAIRGALEGRFSWDAYQATKTTSMAITIITLGINAIRNGMPTAQPTLSPATITRNQFVQLAGEQIVKAGISSAIKQTVSFGLDHLTKGTINHFKSDIEEAVKKVILDNFNTREIQIALDKLFAADLRNGNLANATNLKQLITEILYFQQTKEGISLIILKGVLTNQHSGLGKLLKLADMGNAVANLVSFTQSFCHDFNNAVKLYSAPLPAPDRDFSRYRADLCNQISSTISRFIINYLHKGVNVPATNLAVGEYVDNLANNIQRVCNPFTVEETKTPINFEENNSFESTEADKAMPQNTRPLVKDKHETKHVDIREISGNDQLKSPDGIPLFRNKRGDLKGTHIRDLTVDELKRLRIGTTILYVITPDKKLHLAERFENGKMIFHSDLARDQPVFAAGEINIKKNLFTINSYYIDDCSGHYQPEGEHLKKLVLEKFAEYGLSGSRVFFANQCGVGNHCWENLPSPPLIPDVKGQPSTLGLGESDLFIPVEPDSSKLPAPSQVAALSPLHNNDQVKAAAQEMLDQVQGLKRPPILGQFDKTNALFEAKDKDQLEEHLTEETVCRGVGRCVGAGMKFFARAPGAAGKMAAFFAEPAGKGAEKLCHKAFGRFREDGNENSTNRADFSHSHSTSHNQRVINP